MKLLFFLFLSIQLQSQNVFKGKVINSKGEEIVGANIISNLSDKIYISDYRGSFYIYTDQPIFSIKITHVSYNESVFTIDNLTDKEFVLEDGIYLKDEIKVISTRAKKESPFTFTNISREYILKNDQGKDIPFIINSTPSAYATSDAGNGIGYSGIRIRGSDATRINITINGIPYNDSESHGVFWVNMPDLLSSSNSIQVQRGVGSSTNGGGAFGGTVSIKTGVPSKKLKAKYSTSGGSFNSFKNTLSINSGLINQKFNFSLRLSKIDSDGYIDRAFSDLRSYYASASYYTKRSAIDLINFSGKEKTYQSWWGTPEARINNDENGMQEVIINNGYSDEQANNLLNAGRTFNYYTYENETDNYQQDHYQLHWNYEISKLSNLHLAAHYTFGRGYYEQFRLQDNLNYYFDYMEDKTQDLIRRRWLRNHFYGITYSYSYSNSKSEINVGGAINEYDGDHFGKVMSSGTPNLLFSDPYYFSKSFKRDRNVFVKYKYILSKKSQLFVDTQVRRYFHESNGDDNDGSLISINSKKTFFNPKLGFSLSINEKSDMYFSFAVANREPIRSDFIDSEVKPKHETLYNFELGENYNYRNGLLKANLFLMEYKNQLVSTGEVNDVGAYIRTNVDKSRRYGLEVSNTISTKKFNVESNISLSKNYVFDFREVIYDYGEDFSEYNLMVTNYDKTDIAFSPNLIINNQIEFGAFNNLHFFLKSKFVGKQYLDNTSNINRSIDSFFTNDFGAYINLSNKLLENLFFRVSVNNIFNTLYSSNGYTFGYFAGRSYEIRENYYYPQAGRNFMVSLSINI